MSPLIGLLGKKQSGKDTFARMLVQEHGFARYAFADPLKKAALALDPIVIPGGPDHPPHTLTEVVRECGWENAKAWPEVRRTLQYYGMAIRDLDEGFWLRQVMTPVSQETGPVVNAIEAAGGVLVRILRPGLDRTDTHVSEIALDQRPTEFTFVNHGGLDHLHAEAGNLVRRLTQ
jgi:hypothetical protein